MPTPSVESCIAQLLRNASGVTALVSTRIHIAHRPQGDTLPAVVVRLNDYGDQPNIGVDETQIEPRIAVDCYDDSYDGAYLLDQAVRGIQSHSGSVSCLKADNVTVYGTRTIDAIVAEDTTTDDQAPSDASDQRVYSRSTLFFVLATK
jgi:hypothetical protein